MVSFHISAANVRGRTDAAAPSMLPSKPPLTPEPAITPPWVCVSVRWHDDILAVRRRGESLAATLGFTRGDSCVVGAAVAELARNVVRHAGWGALLLGAEEYVGRRALVVIARDRGPGIVDVRLAMEDGYSTCGSYGLGLSSVRRLMDDFEIESHPGRGTRVTARKWMLTRDGRCGSGWEKTLGAPAAAVPRACPARHIGADAWGADDDRVAVPELVVARPAVATDALSADQR